MSDEGRIEEEALDETVAEDEPGNAADVVEEEMSPAPSHFSRLAIEGVIGVGKTSLCHLLAERWDAALVLEEVEENPFLAAFYKDRQSHAFQTQLWFLLNRYRQLSEAGIQQDLFHKITVGDYLFAKDRIFATLNLDADELGLYNHVAGILEKQVANPDLVVYLQASTDVLVRRIAERGRSFEFSMEPAYIDALNDAYNHFFFHYDKTPLLVVNTDEIDFVAERADFEEIAAQIAATRRGVTYYRPLRTKEKAALRDRGRPEKKSG
jgi:deoxyadenosine/deoxycytidine kinase